MCFHCSRSTNDILTDGLGNQLKVKLAFFLLWNLSDTFKEDSIWIRQCWLVIWYFNMYSFLIQMSQSTYSNYGIIPMKVHFTQHQMKWNIDNSYKEHSKYLTCYSCLATGIIFTDQSLGKKMFFPEKGHIVNNLGFVGQTVSVTATELCQCKKQHR